MNTTDVTNLFTPINLALFSVGVLVASIVGFFLLAKILKWIERGQYNRDKSSMDAHSHYYKWHKYDFNGERDNW